MKLLLVVCLAAAASAYEPIITNYHEEVGIPEAARVKKAEEALDFDGSRIVGGSASSLGAHPFMVSVVLLSNVSRYCFYNLECRDKEDYMSAHGMSDSDNPMTLRCNVLRLTAVRSAS